MPHSHTPRSARRCGALRARLALATAVSLAVTGCASRTSEPAMHGSAELGDPGFAHVHGVDINPADGALYAATDTGVWRVPLRANEAVGKPERVADRWQDTMGFTIAGPDLFYASGHPEIREQDPPHLGLIVSRDRARSWEPVALRGQADFHDIEVTPSGRVYGYSATAGRVLVSTTTTTTYRSAAKVLMRDLSVDPRDENVVWATTPEGLARSTNAAQRFTRVAGAPRLVLVEAISTVLVGVTAAGVVWVTDAAGRREWQQLGSLSGAPQAFTVTETGVFLAADDRGVVASTDGGRTFEVLVPYGGAQRGGV